MKRGQPFSVVYDDRTLVVVNKAPGIAVTADRFDSRKKSLVSLVDEFVGRRLFIVHRIDQETSGLVVFAKDAASQRSLQGAFESRRVRKRYIAVVHGRPAWREEVCELPLVPDGNKRHQTIVDKYHGKRSLTRFRVLGAAGCYCALEAVPETGRTHQIRVHLAALGHAVVCDRLYGPASRSGEVQPVFLSQFKRGWRGERFDERPLLERLGLHAAALVLPVAGGLSVEAPLPRDLSALLNQMRKCASEWSEA